MFIYIQMSVRASRDVTSMGRGPDQHRLIERMTEKITRYVNDGAGDVVAITGAHPWLRLRVGDYRVIFRLLTSQEIETMRNVSSERSDAGVIVERVVHRSELSRALRRLTS
jgi:hypothetical protein